MKFPNIYKDEIYLTQDDKVFARLINIEYNENLKEQNKMMTRDRLSPDKLPDGWSYNKDCCWYEFHTNRKTNYPACRVTKEIIEDYNYDPYDLFKAMELRYIEEKYDVLKKELQMKEWER